MPRTRLRHACAALLLVAAGTPVAAVHAAFHPRYRVRASLHDGAPQVDGTVEVTFTNDSPRPLEEAVIFLFPNRFARPDDAVDDTNRQFVYPKLDFDPGSMQVLDAEDAGAPARVLPTSAAGVPDGTLARIPIAPLAPGASRRLTLRFRTVVPERFGSFGRFDGSSLSSAAGTRIWPRSATTADVAGTAPPPLADFDVELSADTPLEVVLNGRWMRAGPEPAGAAVASVSLPLPDRRAAIPALGDRRAAARRWCTAASARLERAHQRRRRDLPRSCSRRCGTPARNGQRRCPPRQRRSDHRPGAAAPEAHGAGRGCRRRLRPACWR